MHIDYLARRERLIADIEEEVHATSMYTGRRVLHPRVLDALRHVPRHEFVPEELRELAYANHPLSIGHGQTISQPYIVAIMTELLDLKPDHRVLEVGAGSGYQAAVLSCLAQHVYTVEAIPNLYHAARERLARLGYRNVECLLGDGALGWPEKSPFDAVIVTAAASEIPQPLVAQLKPGGRMVIPVGRQTLGQDLLLVRKDESGKVKTSSLLGVAFVPLVSPTLRQPQQPER
ncbi:MAG: protein-L-isoaspartate(D-aspartate) O-methyltransferase [Gammaproteobacteria bacterium]